MRCAGLQEGGDLAELADTVVPADPLVVMFTSGSSGPPKGIIHSHGNALGAVRAGLAARCIHAETRLYLPMPFFWVGGFGSGNTHPVSRSSANSQIGCSTYVALASTGFVVRHDMHVDVPRLGDHDLANARIDQC